MLHYCIVSIHLRSTSHSDKMPHCEL